MSERETRMETTEVQPEHVLSQIIEGGDGVALQTALALERLENERLRASLQKYQTAFEDLQSKHTSSFLSPLDCPDDLFERLKQKIESSDYVETLEKLQRNVLNDLHNDRMVKDEGSLVDNGIEDPSWWVWVTEDEISTIQTKVEPDGLSAEGYIVVTEEDIVDGIANFLAQYIASMPQAKKMSCKELHEAVTKTFTTIDRIGKLKKLWAMGKVLYTLASFGSSALWISRHPFLLRGALMAVKTSGKLVLKALT